MNNYMIRFPAWDESLDTPLGINALNPFSLHGEQEPAPHGVCNTGVMLFDTWSLSAVLERLSDHEFALSVQTHVKDRFLDSLCFVKAVHDGIGIEVVPVTEELNYFVLLEEEIQATIFAGANDTFSPSLAHFMSDSSLEIKITDYAAQKQNCICLLHRDIPFPPTSPIAALISRHCSRLCQGMVTLAQNHNYRREDAGPNSSILSQVETIASALPNEFLRVIWPSQGITVFSSLRRFSIDVKIQHLIGTGKIGVKFSRHVESVRNQVLLEQYIDSTNICESIIQLEATTSLLFRKESHINVTMSVTYTSSRGDSSFTMREDIELHVISRDLIPRTYTGFNNLKELSNAPVALASQLDLSHFLNVRNLHDMGVVLCCDTDQGLQTTIRLIHEWGHRIELDRRLLLGGLNDGRILVIVLAGSHPRGMLQIGDELAKHCDERVVHRNESGLGKEHLLGCVLLKNSDVISKVSENIWKNRAQSVSFVYIDVFKNYLDYFQSLQSWYEVLSKGGVLIGSSFYTANFPHAQKSIFSTSTMNAIQIKNAVELCANGWAVPILVTYFEMGQRAELFESRYNAGNLTNIFPAWYVFSNHRTYYNHL